MGTVLPSDGAADGDLVLVERAERELAVAIDFVAGSGLSIVLANVPYLEAAVARLDDEAAAEGVELVVGVTAGAAGIHVRVQPA